MTISQDADLSALTTVTTQLVAALDSIQDDEWAVSTPCDEWDIAALVDHVTGGNWFTAHILDGQGSDEALRLTMARFADESAGGGEAIQSAEEQLTAFERDGVLDESWDHVAGTLSGRQILRLRLHDLIVHTWDIIQSVRPPASVSQDLINWGINELNDRNSLTARHFQIVGEIEPRTSSDSAATYLAAFGR